MGIVEGKMDGVRWEVMRIGNGEMDGVSWEQIRIEMLGRGRRGKEGSMCSAHRETTNLHYTLPLQCFPGRLYAGIELQQTATSVYKKQPHADITHTDKDL